MTGFLNGETQATATTGTLTFTSPATAASIPGSYAINGSGLTANNGNYTFVQAAGNATALTITQAATTTTLTSSTPCAGQTITFTATVTPVSPGSGTRTGTVTFKMERRHWDPERSMRQGRPRPRLSHLPSGRIRLPRPTVAMEISLEPIVTSAHSKRYS